MNNQRTDIARMDVTQTDVSQTDVARTDVRTILSGKAGLTGIQWVLLSRPARNILRNGLRQILENGCQIGPFELTRAKFKLNSRLLAYYSFNVSNPTTETIRPVSMEVIWEDQSRATQNLEDEPILAMQVEAGRNGLLKPFHQLQYAFQDQNVRLLIWPLDPDYPQLVRLGNPEYAPQLFHTAGVQLKTTESDCIQITPIRYRPGERHVLRYEINSDGRSSAGHPSADCPSGQEKLYAKLYQDPKDAARAYSIANKVVSWLDDSIHAEHGLRGNRPQGMSQEDAVILYPHADGIPLSQQLHRSPAWVSGQLRLVGSALATLHHGPESLVLDLKENILEKEIKVIARAYEHIQVLLPESGSDLLRILERIQKIHDRLPQEKPTFTHSDFKADHLFTSPSGITLIDFDTCALADPALDLGKFMADLEWWYEFHHVSGAEQAQQAFLEGYNNQGDWGRDASQGRLMRAKLYQSLILAKIAVRRTKLYSKNWADTMTKMIQRSGAILQSLATE